MNKENNKSKRMSADDVSQLYLDRQLKEPSAKRVSELILVILSSVIILSLAIAFIILPDKEFSENENRSLKQLPSITLDNILSNKFSAEFGEYMADQFPLRDTFVSIKAFCEMLQLKFVNNDVLISGDQLVDISDNEITELLSQNLYYCNNFLNYAEQLGKTAKLAVAGRVLDIVGSDLPAIYPKEEADKCYDECMLLAEKLSCDTIDLVAPLKEYYENGEYVYYRTDHHWTSLGAYYAYLCIAEEMGITPHPIDSFSRENASDAFYGTTWSSGCTHWIGPDSIEYFRFDGDESYTTSIHAFKSESGMLADTVEHSFFGFYDRDYLSKKDKYSSFLGGNYGKITVTKNDIAESERETLLIIKDSFAHSIAPFLARHYDLILIDTRYYKLKPIYELLDEADHVLILYNIDSLLCDTSLSLLFTPKA